MATKTGVCIFKIFPWQKLEYLASWLVLLDLQGNFDDILYIDFFTIKTSFKIIVFFVIPDDTTQFSDISILDATDENSKGEITCILKFIFSLIYYIRW